MTNTDRGTGIRPYGPGKFNTILDAYVWNVSVDGGTDEECGDVSEVGRWAGLMRNGSTIFRDHDPLLETLNEDEQNQLTSSVGVILEEDSQGFVYVTYYDDEETLESDWATLESQLSYDERAE